MQHRKMKKSGLLERKDFDNMNVNSRGEKVKQSIKPEQAR